MDDLGAIEAALHALRGGDPLLPATVTVGGPVPALLLRRALGARLGIAAVDVVPLRRLAERLAGPLPCAHDGVPGAWEEATRLALVRSPGPFGAVADHPATVQRVAAALRRLRVATLDERSGLAERGTRSAHLVHLLGIVEAAGPWRHTVDVVVAALDALAAGTDPGPVVIVHPALDDPVQARLVDALAERASTRVVARTRPEPEPVPDHLVVAPDAETEARLAVQACAAALADGRPGHEIVLLPLGGTIARRRVAQLLDAAGITWNGPSGETLAAGPAGRAVLGLLRADADGWSARGVLAAVADAPFTGPAGAVLPIAEWRAVLGAARIGAGAEWTDRLRRHAGRVSGRGRERDAVEAASAVDLLAVQASLSALVRLPADASWEARSAGVVEVLDVWVDPSRWPEPAARAHAATRAVLASLARLDRLGGRPTPVTFLAAVEEVLAAATPRHGRVGEGVHVALPAELGTAPIGLLVVTGAVEGAAPARRSEDALLPDEEIALVSGAPKRAERRAAERAALDRALASAGRSVVSSHLADAQAVRLPSRWFLGWAGALHGRDRPVSLVELHGSGTGPTITIVPSFTAAVTGTGASVDAQEVAVASLARWVRAGHDADTHPVARADAVLHDALLRSIALDGAGFGPHHGLVAPALGLDPEVSATELETWAGCPRRHLIGHVLGAGRDEPGDEAVDMAGLERGDLVHRVLELLVQGRAPLEPDDAWGADGRDRALALIATEVLERQQDGRLATGTIATLRVEEVVQAVLGALDLDDVVRADERWTATRAEGRFGGAAEVPVSLRLPSGRTVHFRGRVDRIDRSEDGRRARVLDYKTGRARRLVEAVAKRRSLATLLQLGVYELAARELVPSSSEVESAWWLLEADVPDAQRIAPNPLDRTSLALAVEAITDGIDGGVFPANPGEDGFFGPTNCSYCPYDRACASDRVRRQQLVAADPVLEPWHRLAALDAALEAGGAS